MLDWGRSRERKRTKMSFTLTKRIRGFPSRSPLSPKKNKQRTKYDRINSDLSTMQKKNLSFSSILLMNNPHSMTTTFNKANITSDVLMQGYGRQDKRGWKRIRRRNDWYLYKFQDDLSVNLDRDRRFPCNNCNVDLRYYVCIEYRRHRIFDRREDKVLY